MPGPEPGQYCTDAPFAVCTCCHTLARLLLGICSATAFKHLKGRKQGLMTVGLMPAMSWSTSNTPDCRASNVSLASLCPQVVPSLRSSSQNRTCRAWPLWILWQMQPLLMALEPPSRQTLQQRQLAEAEQAPECPVIPTDPVCPASCARVWLGWSPVPQAGLPCLSIEHVHRGYQNRQRLPSEPALPSRVSERFLAA